MKRLLYIYLLSLLLFPADIYSQESIGAMVTIPSATVVRGKNITLGDIATISGTDKSLIKKLSQVEILRHMPRDITKKIVLRKNSIIARIRQSRIDVNSLELSSPAAITVSRYYQTLDRDEVKSLIEDFLYNRILLDKEYINLSNFSVDNAAIPVGNVSLEIAMSRRITSYKGKISIPVNIFVDSVFVKRVNARIFVEEMRDVAVANRTIDKGAIISEDDLMYKRILFTPRLHNAFTDIGDLKRKVATRAIDAGTIIRKRDVADYFDVSKGKKVLILAESSFVKISAKGIAKESGKKGDFIEVMNINSKKVVIAKVVDSRTVQVEF